MRPVTTTVRRFEAMCCWTNRILRIDLSDMSIRVQESAPHLPEMIGGRGLAARLCWNDYPEPVDPFVPAAPLMVVPGAVTGSRSPYAGRTSVCAFAPQAQPYPWFTRSSIGGRFGGELKRAGYDALVVTGTADSPVRIRIRDDEVNILPSDDLCGLDIMDALQALESADGQMSRALVIGPAGENLSRIATIQTGSSSACGEGGFGAVMGAKRLKAITVFGTGHIPVAAPDTLTSLSKALAQQIKPGTWQDRDMTAFNQELAREGGGTARLVACTEGCLTPCALEYSDMPGVASCRKWRGMWFCFPGRFTGARETDSPTLRAVYPWHLERHAAFEMNVLANRYGLNIFDILSGLVPWLTACQRDGLIDEINGQPMDWNSARFWAMFLHALAYREGIGDALADGGWLASQRLRMGQDLALDYYPGWGYSSHHDGRNQWGQYFPYWVPIALQWMSDSRNPISSGHGSLRAPAFAQRALHAETEAERDQMLAQGRAYGERLYGDPMAVDPYSGYASKACIGRFHALRSVIKDCVSVDDLCFPYTIDWDASDYRPLLRDIEGIGDIDGPSVEYHLLKAVSGIDWSEGEFEHAVRRIYTLERALQVRHWGRDRQTDELVLAYFERPETRPSPFLDGRRQGLDRAQFAPVLDAFYAQHGWDANGRPTHKGLSALGLEDVYEPMQEGAARAAESDGREDTGGAA